MTVVMKRHLLITLAFGLLTFGFGWFMSDMYDFVEGVKRDAVRLDSLRQNDTTFGIIKAIEPIEALYPPVVDTLINDDFEIITKKSDGSVGILRKFNPKKNFKDFPATEKFTGESPKTLNYSTCKYGRSYRSATKSAVEEGANFAGHYAFARMGCGTSCQVSTITDLKTGNVYAGPEANGDYEYRVDSRLIVVNPPDSSGLYYPCGYCTPEQYLWAGDSLVRVE
jgi:hypothetical protein